MPKKDKTQKASDEALKIKELTRRKKTYDQNQMLKHSIDIFYDGIYWMDSDNKFIYINDAGCKILGYSREELLGKTVYDINSRATEQNLKNVWELLRTKGFFLTESVHLRKDGTEFPVEIISTYVKFADREYNCGFVRDITERKQEEEKLRESEERFKTIFDNAIDGILVGDIETKKNLFGNRMICKMLGYEEEEIKNTGVCDLHPEKDLPYVMGQFEKQAKKEIELVKDIPMKRKDGSVFYADINSTPIALGGKTYMLGIFRDITQRKLGDEAMQKSEKNMKDAQRLAHIGSWQWTVATDTVKWSEELYHINGLDPYSPAPGFKEMSSRYTPQSWELLNAVVVKALQRGETYELDLDIVRPDGTIINTSARGEADYDASGKIVGLHGTVQDITRRKRMEEEARLNSEIFKNVSEGIHIIGMEDGLIKHANSKFEQMFGYEPGEMIGKDVSVLNAPTDKTPQETKMDIMGYLSKTGEWHGEVKNIRKDGTPFWSYANISLFNHHQYGRVIVSIHTDITGRKLAEEERIQLLKREHEARSEAEATRKLDRMKSIFIASTSHELRTPLNSIIGFTSLILDGSSGELNPEQKEQLAIVNTCGKHLLALINNIIDTSKIDAGKIYLQVSEFNIGQVVDEAILTLGGQIQEKGLKISQDVEEITIKTDRLRLLQCVINLTGNAVKYTEKGSIKLIVKTKEKKVYISVIDTGIGIRKEDLPKLFGPFVRLQTPLTVKTSGTGLGLFLVKKIAKDFLGGDVEVESEFGKGSIFTLHIPVEL